MVTFSRPPGLNEWFQVTELLAFPEKNLTPFATISSSNVDPQGPEYSLEFLKRNYPRASQASFTKHSAPGNTIFMTPPAFGSCARASDISGTSQVSISFHFNGIFRLRSLVAVGRWDEFDCTKWNTEFQSIFVLVDGVQVGTLFTDNDDY